MGTGDPTGTESEEAAEAMVLEEEEGSGGECDATVERVVSCELINCAVATYPLFVRIIAPKINTRTCNQPREMSQSATHTYHDEHINFTMNTMIHSVS